MSPQTITVEKAGQIALITLSRPDYSNAIDEGMAQGLREACQAIRQDDEIRAVILTGAGQAFCVGGDSPQVALGDKIQDPYEEQIRRCRVADAVARVEKPVIAAINGDALGQGLELALACDLRITQEGAYLGLTQTKQGLIPWDGGTQRLPRLIGRSRALEMILTSRILEAREALSIGLVNEVVDGGQALARCQELASTIVRYAPIAARYAKEAVFKGLNLTMEQGLRLEADLNFLLHSTWDRAEGVRSFLEKREPDYEGR